MTPARRDAAGRIAYDARIGPYEVLGLLGSGGMGEVHRARDPRLGREVAVKMLPAHLGSDHDRLRRFEQEARAAGALSHPNLLTVFDTGVHEGAPYIVFELLEGRTLRQALGFGRLPTRKALDYAVQLAQGLAAAHDKGIVHRDLKPENVCVTKDGRVKILDFGLAKLRPALDTDHALGDETKSDLTGPAAVLGTAGYMAPEQVRGRPSDHRADLFALGTVLYEMLAGRNPFRGDTSADTITAILNVDPSDLSIENREVPSVLDRIVRRCLEKRPEDRFQSARDVAFALEALSALPVVREKPFAVVGRTRRLWVFVVALAAAALVFAAFILGRGFARGPGPSFQRLTFRRGSTWGARIAPDGQTIVYGATWEGSPIQLYSMRPSSPESRPLELPDADILSISSSGELAILLGRNPLVYSGQSLGTLARVPLAGGAPREVLEHVQGADWSPDGKELAVIREVEGHRRLEYPIGTVLAEDASMYNPRVSPQGDLVAFLDHGIHVVDRAGRKRTLSSSWRFGDTLAWTPKGDEIWFPASNAEIHLSLYGVTTSGRQRLITHFSEFARLLDISRDGRVLVSFGTSHTELLGRAPDAKQERILSWLDFSSPVDLSLDGRTLLFTELGQGGGPRGGVYMRRTDGSAPAVRLGDGFALSLSQDATWALATPFHSWEPFPELTLLPTGPGTPKTVRLEGFEDHREARLLPDGQRIVLNARMPGRPWRGYILDVDGGPARALTPEGFVITGAVSPDGDRVATRAVEGECRLAVYPVDGGDPWTIPGPGEDFVGPWSLDGRSLFVAEWKGVDITIFRRNVATGARERWREIRPADPTGILAMELVLGADGRSYAYKFHRYLSNLYLVDGLR